MPSLSSSPFVLVALLCRSREQVLKEQVTAITLQASRGLHLRFRPHVTEQQAT